MNTQTALRHVASETVENRNQFEVGARKCIHRRSDWSTDKKNKGTNTKFISKLSRRFCTRRRYLSRSLRSWSERRSDKKKKIAETPLERRVQASKARGNGHGSAIGRSFFFSPFGVPCNPYLELCEPSETMHVWVLDIWMPHPRICHKPVGIHERGAMIRGPKWRKRADRVLFIPATLGIIGAYIF